MNESEKHLLNALKTSLVLFHSRQNLYDKGNLSIKFINKKLKPVDHVKYLGMYLDKYLSWDMYIKQLGFKLGLKLGRANGIISKLRQNARLDVCLEIYYTRLSYGGCVWGLTITLISLITLTEYVLE